MRIEELKLDSYAAAPDLYLPSLENFTVFYGPNEQGKSLITEAIVKMLYESKRKRNTFQNMDRVKSNPQGHIKISWQGETRTYPDIDFDKVTNITAEDFRNIFYIQDSDLHITGDSYYEDILDRVFNMQTQKIQSILENLQGIGRYTSTGRFSNTKEHNKLKDRVEKAQDVQEEIRQFREGNTGEPLTQLLEHKKDLRKTEEEIQKLEKAKQRKDYEEAKGLFSELQEKQEDVKDLREYNEDDKKEWRKLQTKYQSKKVDLEDKEQEIKEKEDNIKDIQEELKELQRKPAIQRYERLEEELKPKIEEYNSLNESKAGSSHLVKAAKWAGIISAAGLISTTIKTIPVVVTITIVTIVFTIGTFIYYYNLKESTPSEALLQTANNQGLDVSSVKEVKKEFREIEDEYNTIQNSLEDLKGDIETANEVLDNLKKQEGNIKKNLLELKGKIDSIKHKTSSNSLEEYENNLEQKQRLNNNINNLKIQLKSKIDTDKFQEKLNELKKKISTYTVQTEVFNEKELNQLEEDKETLNEKISNTREKAQTVKGEIENFRADLQKIFVEEPPRCQDTRDLEEVEKRLQKFIKKHEERREKCQKAEDILKEIKEEQKQDINNIFQESKLAKETFSKITNNKYKDIAYNTDKEQVVVTTKDDRNLPIEKLSKGATDQLYFSVRISIAEQLLNEHGFLILDDPFLSSDSQRLKKQMNVLADLAQKGWQILYFTAKDEVKENAKDLDVHIRSI